MSITNVNDYIKFKTLKYKYFKFIISVLKDFKLNIVVNIRYRYKVDSLALLLLTVVNLLANVCHII